jgi:transposase
MKIAFKPAPDMTSVHLQNVQLSERVMVDKAVYHLPLYRQHQRMLDSGVTDSRATLINWIQKSIELLRLIYQAMLRQMLQSSVLVMDEVPMKAGRKQKGKMKQTYFWPIDGEQDEVAFTWSTSGGHNMLLTSCLVLAAPCSPMGMSPMKKRWHS